MFGRSENCVKKSVRKNHRLKSYNNGNVCVCGGGGAGWIKTIYKFALEHLSISGDAGM